MRIHQIIHLRFVHFIVSFALIKEQGTRRKYRTLGDDKHAEIFKNSVLRFMIYFEMHQKYKWIEGLIAE